MNNFKGLLSILMLGFLATACLQKAGSIKNAGLSNGGGSGGGDDEGDGIFGTIEACRITIASACTVPANYAIGVEFNDPGATANSNIDACMARAAAYQAVCKSAGTVTATAYDEDGDTQETIVAAYSASNAGATYTGAVVWERFCFNSSKASLFKDDGKCTPISFNNCSALSAACVANGGLVLQTKQTKDDLNVTRYEKCNSRNVVSDGKHRVTATCRK